MALLNINVIESIKQKRWDGVDMCRVEGGNNLKGLNFEVDKYKKENHRAHEKRKRLTLQEISFEKRAS